MGEEATQARPPPKRSLGSGSSFFTRAFQPLVKGVRLDHVPFTTLGFTGVASGRLLCLFEDEVVFVLGSVPLGFALATLVDHNWLPFEELKNRPRGRPVYANVKRRSRQEVTTTTTALLD